METGFCLYQVNMRPIKSTQSRNGVYLIILDWLAILHKPYLHCVWDFLWTTTTTSVVGARKKDFLSKLKHICTQVHRLHRTLCFVLMTQKHFPPLPDHHLIQLPISHTHTLNCAWKLDWREISLKISWLGEQISGRYSGQFGNGLVESFCVVIPPAISPLIVFN